MSVRVRLFASYREAVGAGELAMPVVGGLTAGQLWDELAAEHPDLPASPASLAVNHVVADQDTELVDDDEVAFLPPVGGG